MGLGDSPNEGSNSIAGLYLDDKYQLHYPTGMRMTDGVPEELRPIVNVHWDQFPPINPLVPFFFAVMFFFLWVMSFVGNGCVIFIFLKVKSLRTPTNMFVINLALADMCMMTTQAPSVTVNIFMQRYWAWGVFGCELYGFLGAVFGCVSILSMVVIGYDRYNVIVKGFNGTKITPGKALIILLVIWAYCIGIGIMPLLGLWGNYAAEGLLYTCSYDYLSPDWSSRTFVMFAFVFNYCLPMLMVFFYYSSIVKAVWAHEHALKAQAKKMNVDSLRSNTDANAESAEMRIAKVAVTNVSLWACIWSPYAFVVAAACMGCADSITPLMSQIPSFVAKTASCLNPIVYATSHPKYREALTKELPCLGVVEHGSAGSVKETVNTDTE